MADATQATGSGRSLFDGLSGTSVWLPIGTVIIIAVLVVPLPPWMLDLGIGISFAFSVLVLMIALMVERPLHFSSFPVVLLIATMIRLSLNLASTRLILSEGRSGTGAAGEMIEAFAEFVMQGEFLIGLIVFAILVTVNFVVITKGATRIAEVTARFSLDAMPGKQMAIDADLSSGIIDEQEAKRRRQDLQEESSFYGSMDGASKFVRGDAIAGLVITFINLIGGILVGVTQHGMTIGSAAETYATLTVGDGLVTQIPALVVSLASGMLVSKGAAKGAADNALLTEFKNFPPAFYMAAGLFMTLGLVPGLPVILMLFFAGLLALTGYIISENQERQAAEAQAQEEEAQKPEPRKEKPADWLQEDDLRIELGLNLMRLITRPDESADPEDPNAESDLASRVENMRKRLAREFGFVMPEVRLMDNPELGHDDYRIVVKDRGAATGNLDLDRLLVLGNENDYPDIDGDKAVDPAFGIPAKWATPKVAQEAEDLDYLVVKPGSVLMTHFHEVVKANMPRLLSYQATQDLLSNVPDKQRRPIDDLVPAQVSVSTIKQVLQQLLSEGVSIKSLPSIVEAIGEVANKGAEMWQIVEHVRTKLAYQICSDIAQHHGQDNKIIAVQLSRHWEDTFAQSVTADGNLNLNPSRTKEFAESVSAKLKNLLDQGAKPIIICSKNVRPFVRGVTGRIASDTPVLAHDEYAGNVGLTIVDEI